jgi:excisionase family DNA binding protein
MAAAADADAAIEAIFTTNEVAARWDCHPGTVARLIDRGELAGFTLAGRTGGSRYRVTRAALIAYERAAGGLEPVYEVAGAAELDPTMTPSELARRWKCTTETVHHLVQRGELPGFRIGILYRIHGAAVSAFEAQTVTSVR